MSRSLSSLGQPRITTTAVRKFRRTIYDYHRAHRRDLPWRRTRNPYRIFISEVMLQQTQVDRVREKYREFVKAFPGFSSLAAASLGDVLRVWKGLGYNRRAVALHRAARLIVEKFRGRLPDERADLMELSGIGEYTASAILTFAFNRPEVFIETNVRSVFIHFFFQDRQGVRDDEILPIIRKTLDVQDPREWYYALMDYGSMLKRQGRNPGRRSALYQRPSPFKGSNRQMRGLILKILIDQGGITKGRLVRMLNRDPALVEVNLTGLEREGFLKKKGRVFTLA